MASAVDYPPTNKVYVFGGEDAVSGHNYNTTRIYDVATNAWSTGAPMPDVRSFAASGYNPGNQRIYVVAGYNTGQVTSAQDTVWEYNPAANSWAVKTPIPHAVGGPGFGIAGGHMIVAGGRDATNTVINLCYDYTIAADTVDLPEPAHPEQRARSRRPISGACTCSAAATPSCAPAARSMPCSGRGPAQPQTTGETLSCGVPCTAWQNEPTLNQIRSFPGGTSVGGTTSSPPAASPARGRPTRRRR